MALKNWKIKPVLSVSQQVAVDRLITDINVSHPIAKLLVQRGIESFEEAKAFFRPKLEDLFDPFLMKDMPLAVERLQRAISNKEKILVYGDYDVDGSTAVAVFYDFFRGHTDQIDFYIPDRNKEGYGVSWQGIEYARENDVRLIVTLDCGIKSVDKIEEASRLGIDVIVCDHHLPGEIPPAVAVLDPKRADCPYPFKELTGCGVGFKLILAFCSAAGIPIKKALSYLDLVMVSIAADIVPVTGENRILAYYGLQLLNKEPRPGLKALIEIAGLRSDLNITNVVFGLAPRINAAGRIHHAKAAVELLIAEDLETAQDFAKEINEYNEDRKGFDSSITVEALAMIASDEWMRTAHSTVLFQENWHKGVIGIVASRCIEHYHRPTVIFTQSNGKATGSARSVPGFDLHAAIEACSDLLDQFGGHPFAAGLTLPVSRIDEFRIRFDEVVRSRILPEQLIPGIEIDLELNLADLTAAFYRVLCQIAPFGPGNMTPVFVSRGITLVRPPFIMKEKHLKIVVTQPGGPEKTAVSFGGVHYLEQLDRNEPFSMCYTLEENEFRGVRSLQLMVKDIKIDN